MTSTPAPTPPPQQQQQPAKADKWNVVESNLSAAAKRRLKELAPFNSPGTVTKGECDFDSILGFTGPENDATRRSRRTRQQQQPAPVTTIGSANGLKRKRPLPMALTRELPIKSSTRQEKFEMTKKETKKEVTTGTISIAKKKADAKTPKKKNQHTKKLIEQKIRKKLPLKQVETFDSSCLSEETKDGDLNAPQKDFVEVVYSEATRRKLIDRKRRKKSQKLSEKSSSRPAQRPSRDLVNLFPELPTSSKPKKEKKVSPSDGVIPSFLPASVQKALKELAPHNTPGNTTAGDNSFILSNALYASQSESRGRRSRRGKKKKINYNENDASTSESRGRRNSRQKNKAMINYIEESEQVEEDDDDDDDAAEEEEEDHYES